MTGLRDCVAQGPADKFGITCSNDVLSSDNAGTFNSLVIDTGTRATAEVFNSHIVTIPFKPDMLLGQLRVAWDGEFQRSVTSDDSWRCMDSDDLAVSWSAYEFDFKRRMHNVIHDAHLLELSVRQLSTFALGDGYLNSSIANEGLDIQILSNRIIDDQFGDLTHNLLM